MDPDKTDAQEVLETPEEVAAETTNETPEDEQPTAEQIAKWKELEKTNPQLFARAKKAEEDLKALKAQGAPSSDGLSTKDVLYLAKADIHAEDVDDVLNYAKKMGVSVSEAHKFYAPILSERAQERKSANAAHTKGGARGTSKVSGDDLLRKAEQTGEVPDDAEGMQKLFEARQQRRLAS
jgi:hypothetical protein